jgi:O-antigen/teichoic acid export membrane protein
MAFLSQAFSNALFKDFAHRDYIPYKLFLFNALWLITALVGLVFLSEWLVKVLLGPGYQTVAYYVNFLAVAHLFQGLYQPFAFLSAKSWGKAVRNVSIIESVINVVGSIVLIIMFGIYGALITSIAAKLTHFLGLWYYYRQYRSQVR